MGNDHTTLDWRAPLWLVATLAAVSGAGCTTEGCLDGNEDGCIVPSPCQKLSFTCESDEVSLRVIEPGDVLPGGPDALASPGDFVLQNDRVTVVIDALDHPHYIAPTGGSILDMATADGDDDRLNAVFQATGLLPGDAVRYTSHRIIEQPGLRAVQFRGHLDGHPDQPVATRYEIRPCEPGVRIRTEAVNREPDPAVWTLTDAWFWGGHGNLPFTPNASGGFEHPEIELDSASDAFVSRDYMTTLPSDDQEAAVYATVACNADGLTGFHSDQVSATGRDIRIVPPRGHEVFERFIAVAAGRSVSAATDVALEVRRQLFGEEWALLEGQLSMQEGDLPGREARATVRVHEVRGERHITRTQVTPDASGHFEARVPANRTYRVDVETFGRTHASANVEVGEGDARVEDIPIEPAARLTVAVTLDGAEGHALVFVHPADDATRDAVETKRFGQLERCAPLLGSPAGGSPACDRLLVEAATTVAVPPGSYFVYATAGPYHSLARKRVELSPGDERSVLLELSALPLQPEGTLSADFHVHGAPSFDSSIPDEDRVRAFLASGTDVIVATDHDRVHDYSDAVAALGAGGRLAVVGGLETTGHILFDYVPESDFPQVVGHWNFWPLEHVADDPYRGAVWDELMQPGMLFTRVEETGWPAATGVIQLNHPWGESDFGRDIGFPRAIGLDATRPLSPSFDGTGHGLFHHRPEGAAHKNSDYHVQEVMNGTENALYQSYRALWFYLLNQGVVRGGTANSDSHALSDHVLGTPRTLVWTDTRVDSFDLERFNASVREGRMLGTNGPVIEAELLDGAERHGPSSQALEPAAGAELAIAVTAAPWVPVQEVRVVVNGEVVWRAEGVTAQPADPFGTEGLLRYEGSIPLEELLADAGRDAWIVVEAGDPLMPAADLDCDGIPDTGDNDGNGRIDEDDVDVDANADTPAPAKPTLSSRCQDDVGPLRPPPLPRDREADDYHFSVVTPRGRPAAFTNPFLIDRDGGGFGGAGQ